MVLLIQMAKILYCMTRNKYRFHNACNAHQPGKPRCSLSLRSMMSDMLGMAFSLESAATVDSVIEGE